MRSLKKEKEILVIGSWGVERRGNTWKAKGRGRQTGRQFTVWEEATGKWRVSGTNSEGSRRRERFLATDLAEAIQQGGNALYQLCTDPDHPQLDLAAAFEKAILSTGGSKEYKENLRRFAGYFCDWAEERGIVLWHEIRFEHVRDYMQAGFNRGLKSKTVSCYLEPVRIASRFLAANWPDHYRDICSALRMPANAGKDRLYRGEDGNPVLSFEEVLDFLDWLRCYPSADVLIPAVLLQGICGLQLREALRLRWFDVNLVTRTITIQDHPEYGERVKNEYRVRRIPLPVLVWQGLEAMQSRTGKVVPYEENDKAFGKLLKYALLKWNPRCDIAPKDLRNTLQTRAMEHAIDEGWNRYLVDRYVGHAPETIAERHYFGDKRSRMVDVFREHVSTKIDALIERIQEEKGHKTAQPISIVPFLEASERK